MSEEKHRLTRIYTRAGDAGTTRLVGGGKVLKSDPRIAAYGSVDELSAALGVARSLNRERPEGAPARAELDGWLRAIQNELFVVGADLATRQEDRWPGMQHVGAAEIQRLEEQIDRMNEVLGPLQEFLLPGGGPLGAQLHVARTVCRRAERDAVALGEGEPVEPGVLAYLNRLSDHLFVLARWAARATGDPEEMWER